MIVEPRRCRDKHGTYHFQNIFKRIITAQTLWIRNLFAIVDSQTANRVDLGFDPRQKLYGFSFSERVIQNF